MATTAKKRSERLEFRLETGEKEAFEAASDLAGIPLSSWVRERLRSAAWKELLEAGRKIPFIPPVMRGAR